MMYGLKKKGHFVKKKKNKKQNPNKTISFVNILRSHELQKKAMLSS